MLSQNFKIIIFGFVLSFGHSISAATANTELSKMRDCTEIELEAVIDQDASREDNLARLSQQFFQSVNTIEHCDREQDSVDAASSTGSGSIPSSADTDEADATRDSGAMTDSTASGSLVGTNFNQTMNEADQQFASPSASNITGTTPQPTPAETNTTGAQTDATEQDLTLTNGKTPDDIPDADNDSVFEAQIRAAAMAETDPDTKKNLWNEYRRYKGLPEKK